MLLIMTSFSASLCLSSNLRQLIAFYLYHRKHRVRYKNITPEKFVENSGVPQGSNLGPLLFLLFVNDLPGVITSSNKLLFADNLKIYCSISSELDAFSLQNYINAVSNWRKTNMWILNI